MSIQSPFLFRKLPTFPFSLTFPLLNPNILPETPPEGFQYELLVIGGGSGGLACAKRASDFNIDVAVCDYVTPSATLGTKWGLGGTCVNVGCIPKKLMHTAALCGETIRHFAPAYGWESASPRCDWGTLRNNVIMHIKSLNFGYNVELRQKGVFYHNARAVFDPTDPHRVHLTDKHGQTTSVRARNIVLAMGGRPTLPENCPGAREYGITSDDLFRLERDPGKTCVVGASYVALECAGMLSGIGRPATVLMRSIPLRGYDQDMAAQVASFMEEVAGVKFVKGAVPSRIELSEATGKRIVSWRSPESGEEISEEFDTVLFAIGRTPETREMRLPVSVDSKSGKVVTDRYLKTDFPFIHALGDIVHGGLELTPVAIHQGIQLANNICSGALRPITTDTVASTVFTPLEYGFVGLSEAEAMEKLGEENIDVFHLKFTPLEWALPHFARERCYVKVIVDEADKVIGFHILAPNAGEITQGIAIAMRAGVTKAMLDETIGIHPTVAEEVTNLSVTKRSGEDPSKGNC